MKDKPTILMLPSWYPSKAFPLQGTFFREQALVLQKNYNFLVLRMYENKQLWPIYLFKKFIHRNKSIFSFIKDDNGLKEYSYIFYIPSYFIINDLINKILRHKKKIRQGTGYIETKLYKYSLTRKINYIKKKQLLPKFDCVYSLTTQDMAVFGKEFSTLFSVPHVTAEHAPFPWPGTILKDTVVNAIETADAFLAISNDKIRQLAFQRIILPKTFLVGNLCDEEHFSNTKLKSKSNIRTFLIVAGNSLAKNYPMFIKTMEELNNISTKDFKIIIAGYGANIGYSNNDELFEKNIKDSSINDKTTLIRSISREEMPKLYNQADAFVLTSYEEGLPVCTLEAVMSGLPVFSTRCGGVEDYVDESMGRLVSITDYKKLAEYCNDFLNGKIIFDSEKIRKKAIELFGKEAFIKRMSQAFDYVLTK